MTTPTNPPVAFSPVLARNLADIGWSQVELLATVGSTNAYALESPQSWHFVAADDQHHGRGRLDRVWEVPPGVAATVSMTIPLWRGADASQTGWVPLYIGVATLRAICSAYPELSGADIGLKWPNDILIRSDGEWRKVGGILCQMTPDGLHVVAGIGINVAQTSEQLPVETATSLFMAGLNGDDSNPRISRDALLLALGQQVMRVAREWAQPQGRELLQHEYRQHCLSVSAVVEVHVAGSEPQARFVVEIDELGQIVTEPSDRTAKPHRVTYAVADIIHARMKGQ